jgi:transcriptional regulator with XRE-family HTH domain
MDNISIGKRIEQARELRGLTMVDLANQIGVAKSTVQRYEKGKINKIKLPVIGSIARALNVNPLWIIGKTDNMDVEKKDDLDRLKDLIRQIGFTVSKRELIDIVIDMDEEQAKATLDLLIRMEAYAEYKAKRKADKN